MDKAAVMENIDIENYGKLLQEPFTDFDFDDDAVEERCWLMRKILRIAKLPRFANFYLTMARVYGDDALAAIPYDELVQSVDLLVPYCEGRVRVESSNMHSFGLIQVAAETLLGAPA